MTTKTQTPPADMERATDEFEAYLDRTMPSYLRPDQPVPPSWPHSPEAWRMLQQSAAGLWSEQAMLAYVQQLAKGWLPRELAQGTTFGQGTRPDGSPVRPLEPSVPADVSHAAAVVLKELANRAISLGDLEMNILQAAANGYGGGNAMPLIEQARSKVRQHDYDKQAARAAVDISPILTVRAAFRGKRGIEYTPGTYHVTEETAGELRAWQTEMEAQGTLHHWDAPHGFHKDSWPPFTLTASAAPKDDELGRGG